jgi:hypothetical protein
MIAGNLSHTVHTMQMPTNQVCRKLINIVIVFLFFNCNTYQTQINNQGLKVHVFEINKGWGYKIELNNKTIIYQPFIPVISGEVAFKSKNDALKTGNLVMNKILNNKVPTLTKEDLVNNGISF